MENKILPCPVCGNIPTINYACGEYFIIGNECCRFCASDGVFCEMHASESGELNSWNAAVTSEAKSECPLGGDESDDCSGCAYSLDYHFVNGECATRNNL